MQEIFYRTDINQKLDHDGYIILPVLSDSDIRALRELYHSLSLMPDVGTQVTMFRPSYEYRSAVDRGIKAICAEKISALVRNYRPLYSNFMTKYPGPEGDFPVHQDWTYVDESKHVSLAFWIPLHDVDINNGTLHVVPGSHKLITQLRGPYVYEPFRDLSSKIREKYSTPIPLRAGEALIWDHRLVHFSLPNTTSTPRLAATVIMVPDETEVIHCYALPESHGITIQKYQVDTDFYMHYMIGSEPHGAILLEKVGQPAVTFDENIFESIA